MTENPDFYLDSLVQAGTTYPIVRFEACRLLHSTLSRVVELKTKV